MVRDDKQIRLPLSEMRSQVDQADSRETGTLPKLQATTVGLGGPWQHKEAAFESLRDCKRFWTKVVISDTQFYNGTQCWLWIGAKSPDGYGLFCRSKLKDQPPRSSVGAHRASFESYVKPIPEGLTLDHLCLVKRCVNYDHLEPVTHRENTMRANHLVTMINKAKTHCIRGHKYDRQKYLAKRGPLKATLEMAQAVAKELNTSEEEGARIAAIRLHWEGLTQEQKTARAAVMRSPEAMIKQLAACALRRGIKPASLAVLHSPEVKAKAKAAREASRAARVLPDTCRLGHQFDGIKANNSQRYCKTCHRLWLDANRERTSQYRKKRKS